MAKIIEKATLSRSMFRKQWVGTQNGSFGTPHKISLLLFNNNSLFYFILKKKRKIANHANLTIARQVQWNFAVLPFPVFSFDPYTVAEECFQLFPQAVNFSTQYFILLF